MMKAANNGAAAFGEVERPDDKEGGGGGGGGRGRKNNNADDDEGNVSYRGEEDEDEEFARKNRLGLNKRGGDDDEECPRGGDLDFDDDDIEKGDCFVIWIMERNDTFHLLLEFEFSMRNENRLFVYLLLYVRFQVMSGSMRRFSQMMMKQLVMILKSVKTY